MVCLAVMLSGAFMAVTSCTNAGYSTPFLLGAQGNNAGRNL